MEQTSKVIPDVMERCPVLHVIHVPCWCVNQGSGLQGWEDGSGGGP